jgi:parallel beta-helix repeat protein
MRIRAIAVLIAASLWGQLWAQSDWSNVAQQAKDSIIKIIAHHSEGEATGTGFAVSADGKIATNYHVIEKASKIFVKLPDGRTIGIERVVAFDKRVDLAILQVRDVSLRPLPLGDSNAVKVGQEVCVMGSPLGLEQSFSTGVVSAKRVLDGFEWVQITAPISPGSSGSPVMNRDGAVIGVATFTTREGQNLNFAAPVNFLKQLLNGEPIKPEVSSLTTLNPTAHAGSQEQPSSVLVTNEKELLRAIAEIRDGGEITMQPGEYHLREPLVIQKSLTIVGAGYKETKLIFEGRCTYVMGEGMCGGIKFSGDDMLAIRDLSVRYSGVETGCAVIEVSRGDLRLTRCFISGGIGRDEQKSTIGCGIWIHGTAQAVISGCVVADNEVGIGVGRQAKARIELCEIFSNEAAGVLVRDTASCEVRHCKIQGNQVGVAAIDTARLVARNNTCEGNATFGIALWGSAQGEVEGNTCRNNSTGISAIKQSRLVARNNTCEGNATSGIALFDSAQGAIVGNTCRNNGVGIGAINQSRLVARNNTCEGNEQLGIALFDSAQGEIVGNTCRNNGIGISAINQSRLVARNNTCEGNATSGIALNDSVQGEVEGNQCINNEIYGIFIFNRGVGVTLRNNFVYGNRSGDIYDPRR